MIKIFNLIFCVLLISKLGYSQYSGNYAVSFNGFNSYIAVPNTSDFNPSSALTLEAWVNPSALGPSTMSVIGKNYQTSYFIGIQVSGRVVFYPKAGSSFRSRVTSVVPVNQWTHIAGTYDGTTTSIYINGFLDTTTNAFSGAVGTNSDSLFLGADRVGSTTSLFFKGRIDNIRIWNGVRSSSEIFDSRFIPIEILSPSGAYQNLRASFQLDNNMGTYSGSGNHPGFPRNLTLINYSNKPVNYLDYNNNLVLNGTTDYMQFFNPFGSGFDPTTAITLEAWIKRDTTGVQPNDMYIVDKSGGTDGINYALWLFSATGTLKFKINSPGGPSGIISSIPIQNAQWTHVAATYNSATGNANLYVNGNPAASGSFVGSPVIQTYAYHLYIGGIGATSLAANKFKGQIDGVRIWSVARTASEIKENMYTSGSSIWSAHFDFDKYTTAVHSGTYIFTTNTFFGTSHISSSHNNKESELTSPMLTDDPGGFHSYFSNSYKRFFIPDNNLAGIKDSIFVISLATITNLTAYVLMSHTWISDMTVKLTSPAGTSVTLFNGKGGNGNDLMTIFSDDADSVASLGTAVNSAGINPPFSPEIKPEQPLSILNGQNRSGWWKIQFNDNASADIGYVHGWGVNVSNLGYKILYLKAFIQGFYRISTGKMIKDTVSVILRNAASPYSVVDTAKKLLDSTGNCYFIIRNTINGTPYYLVLKHRNSIETWSSVPKSFSDDVLNYDFSISSSQAYGNNEVYVDALDASEKSSLQYYGSTERYAIYSGDSNQDGIVDATDLAIIDNDAYNFRKGYLNSDLTGDNVVDASDAALADNNAANFVSKITP
ncbi:MAG: LamG-like jellyroll fold domain-containing protein, partial [bacterium]